MSKKYHEVMDKIVVDEEMRQRILQNIQQSEFTPKMKFVRFPHWKQFVSIAACFAVILVGALVVPTLLNPQTGPLIQDENPPGLVFGSGTIEECASIDELAQVVGFSVSELSNLPFKVSKATYTSFWAEVAEIDYCGENGESAVYRKSVGTADNSGIYTAYPDVTELTLNGLSVTLKGTDGIYELVWWTDGKYAYSVCLSEGLSQAEWEIMIFGQH